MTPEHVGASAAAALAGLHAQAFEASWSAAEFADLLGQAGVFALAADDQGFILMREVAGEAEVLTLAVAPAARRQGLGRALLAAALVECARRGVQSVFLEVAADNLAALDLYKAAGFARAGLRRGYYARSAGAAVDALILRCELNSYAP